jgi:apolipoprotein N-acyltransferase
LIDLQSARLRNSANVLLLFFLGVVLATVAELPYGGWIQIPILSLIWWRMDQQLSSSIKNQFILGMSFGLGYFVLGLWWIYISLHDVGGIHAALSCLAVFLLATGMALYFSTASLSLCLVRHQNLTGLVLASSWVMIEYLRSVVFTGFPWGAIGYAQYFTGVPVALVAVHIAGATALWFAVCNLAVSPSRE